MFDQQRIYQAALWLIPGVGDLITKQLIAECGSAESVFKTGFKKLIGIPGVGEKTAREILSQNCLAEAEELIGQCDKNQVKMVHFTDRDYPYRLRQLLDSPAFLFTKGNMNLDQPKAVAMVGTRRASSYGKKVVEEIIDGLIPHKAMIISGLAYGIDIHAHKSALSRNLPTVAVIAGGINHIYPSVHTGVAKEMMNNGGLVAEFPPETIPDYHHFPDRNRIIAGLSDVTIVVETAPKGGATITAEFANNYNREVFAVPGDIHWSHSEGCNRLIRNHKAHIYTSPADIEYLMNWDPVAENKKPPGWDKELTQPEKNIVEVFHLNKTELMIDELSWKSQIPLNQLAGHLLSLEFKGLVKSLPGKRYRILI